MKLPSLLKFFGTSKGLLLLGFGLSFIHLFWYGSVWTAWMALICYIPFILWLRDYSKRPFIAGLTFGFWYAQVNAFWLGQFVGKWTGSLPVAAFVVLFVGFGWGCFFGLGSWALKASEPNSWKILLIAVFPIAVAARFFLPELEFPLSPIGEPLIVYPVMADVAKVISPIGYGAAHLVEVLILLGMAICFWGRTEKRAFNQKVVAGVGILAIVISQFFRDDFPAPKQKIALGQLGFDMAYGDAGSEPIKVNQAVTDLQAQAIAKKADLLILPEAVTHFGNTPYTPFTLTKELPILFGAQHGYKPTYQSAWLWDGSGFQHTDKINLVLFGEYVPFRKIIPYPSSFNLPGGDLLPGKERTLLTLRDGTKIGAMVCYESFFTGASYDLKQKGAEWLAITSLDDWYIGTAAIPRLMMAARWRAVEARKWVFRVGSLGKTMIIDPRGRIRAELPVGDRRLLMLEEL